VIRAEVPVLGQSKAPVASSAGDETLSRAEQADLAGNFAEATRLYDQIAQGTHDQELKIRCLNRSQFLRDATRSGQVMPTRLASMEKRPAGSPATRAPMAAYYPAQTGAAPTQYCYVVDPCSTVRLRPPVLSSLPAPTAPTTRWYGPAVLYRASFTIDGQPAYRLEPLDGQKFWYATSTTGIDLGQFIGRTVYVAGQMSYRTDGRFFYMPVLQINPPR
jgi:hypothetical protein